MSANDLLFDKWVRALRSGDYDQCINWLRKGESFCCLGVLCDVAGGKWAEDNRKVTVTYTSAEGQKTSSTFLNGDLPRALSASLGLSASDTRHLTHLNDERGFSFGQIADYLVELRNEANSKRAEASD